jgi:hypothetical protein
MRKKIMGAAVALCTALTAIAIQPIPDAQAATTYWWDQEGTRTNRGTNYEGWMNSLLETWDTNPQNTSRVGKSEWYIGWLNCDLNGNHCFPLYSWEKVEYVRGQSTVCTALRSSASWGISLTAGATIGITGAGVTSTYTASTSAQWQENCKNLSYQQTTTRWWLAGQAEYAWFSNRNNTQYWAWYMTGYLKLSWDLNPHTVMVAT